MKQLICLLKSKLSVLVALGILLATSPAISAEKSSDEWDVTMIGYLFAVNIDAISGVGTPAGASEVPVDLGFSDLSKQLDFAFSGLMIAKKGRLSLNVDVSITELSKGIDETIPVGPGTAFVDADIDVGIKEFEVFAGYKFFQQFPDLEVIAGARYIEHDIEVDVNVGPAALNVDIGDDWVDPFIGLQYHAPINDKWSLLVRGDVGGFGVGSDFTWRFNAGATYKLSNNWEAAFMYKILDIDYESGSKSDLDYYKWDGDQQGILVGVGYHF